MIFTGHFPHFILILTTDRQLEPNLENSASYILNYKPYKAAFGSYSVIQRNHEFIAIKIPYCTIATFLLLRVTAGVSQIKIEATIMAIGNIGIEEVQLGFKDLML